MATRLVILLAGSLLAATDVHAQSAGEALRAILFRGESGATGALTENSSSALYGLLLGETTTFPIGSSAGGFTWIFDSSLQVPIRRSQSFGPMFAERPFTTGKGSLNVGVVFQHTSFASVGGRVTERARGIRLLPVRRRGLPLQLLAPCRDRSDDRQRNLRRSRSG